MAKKTKVFTAKDEAAGVAKMKHMRAEIAKLLLQYRENTEAALVAGSLLQLARELYDKYPASVREKLVEGAVAFLEGRVEVAGSGLIIPPGGTRVQ